MTNDELRALADALDGCNPYRDSSAVYSVAAYLRAQADAQPVAWMHIDGRVISAATMDQAYRDGGAMQSSLREYTIPLYTHPAPAVPHPSADASRDAYEGCREDLLDWKRRALKAEREARNLAKALADTVNGPTFMGEPAAPQAEPIDPHMIVAEDRFPDVPAEPKREPSCLWSRADDDTDVWETKCGHAFTIIDGTPTDNQMAFCCYCGRRVDEEIGGRDAE